MVPRAVHMGHPSGGDYAAPSMMRLAGMGLQEKSTHDRRSSKTGACRHPTYVVCKQSMMQWLGQLTAQRDRRQLNTRDQHRLWTAVAPGTMNAGLSKDLFSSSDADSQW